MQVIFNELAKNELDDAVIYYELEVEGLGEKFKEEVKKSIKRMVSYPEACSIEKGDIRKCLLHKFPYKILYSIESDCIFIIAIAHTHRRPCYWAGRI